MQLTRAPKLVIAATLLWGAATPKPKVYWNEEFGITVPVPKSALLCVYPDQHDHGPVFILGTTDAKSCRDDIERSRYIDVFASYQTEDTKRLRDFLRSECVGVAGAPCGPAPDGLHVAGLRSEAARVNRSDGWIYVIVATRSGKPDPAFDPTIPSVNYDLSLHTTPDHLEDDLRVFRIVLRTIRLSPPPPVSAGRPITTH